MQQIWLHNCNEDHHHFNIIMIISCEAHPPCNSSPSLTFAGKRDVMKPQISFRPTELMWKKLIRRGQPPQNCQFRTKITFYGPANADIQILIWNIMNEYLFPAKIIFDLCDSETSEKDRILHNWICPKWPFPRMLWSRWENWSRKLWRSAVNWNKTKSLSKILLNDIFENQTGLFWMQS